MMTDVLQAAATELKSSAATVAELESACPKADEKFLLEAIKKGWSVDEAKTRYIENLQAQVEMREQETVKAREEAETAAKSAKKPGVDASLEASGSKGTQEYSGSFDDSVSALIEKGKTRAQAVALVAKRDPEGHKEYLLERNSGSRVHKLINDRFDQNA